jgi:transcriptional regulator with XRE-family HTH domain
MAGSTIGERIREAREKKGWSRADLAQAVNVTQTATWNWERRGMRPRGEMLAKLAKALGVSERYLKGAVETGTKAGPNNITEILEECRQRIAVELGVPPYRVRVVMELTSGDK